MVWMRSPVAMGTVLWSAIQAMSSKLSGMMGSSRNMGAYLATLLAKSMASPGFIRRCSSRQRSMSSPTASRIRPTRSTASLIMRE